MKAPEKIYRTTTYLDNNRGKTVWKETPVKGAENIEYVRKDAFIEKTCEWIKSMWSETDDRFKEDYTGMLIKIFKNYIEGE